MNSNSKGKYKSIPRSLRLLVIIEEMVSAGMYLTPTEIINRTGLPKPTVHRLFATLETEGFLQRNLGGRTYAPGYRLRKLSTDVLSTLQHNTTFFETLRSLADTVGETCNIAAPERDGMIYIDRAETKWPIRIQMPIGSLVPFHCSASGKIYLSTLNDKQLDRFLESARLSRYGPNSIQSTKELLKELDRVRSQGWAEDEEEYMEGMVGIGVPISNPEGDMFATLTIHGPKPRFSLEVARTHISLLRQTAEKLAKLTLQT